MNPIDLVAWAFWGGISLIILSVPVAIFGAMIQLVRKLYEDDYITLHHGDYRDHLANSQQSFIFEGMSA